MRKLFLFFVALLATTTLFGQEYFSLISVSDGTAADWDALPPEYVASATHTEGCSLDGLKSVKVFADDASINLLVEWNPAGIDLSCVPFLVFINVDPGAATGGFGGDYWMDPNDIDLLTEGFIFLDGMPCAYEPGLFAYGGAYNINEWNWTELVPASSDWIKSQHVGDNKMEIQMLRELIPGVWGDEFTIGFDIQDKSWCSVGVLPNAPDDELGNRVLAEKLRVKVCESLLQDGLRYEITSHVEPYTVAVVDADADITTATIPETIELYGKTYAVTSIGAEAFADCTSLTSITILNSITSIGNYAFFGCSSLTSITIPNSVTSIGNYAFRACSSLTSITIPNSITEINSGIFSGCSSLTSITIPNSITSIGSDAFYHCTSLTSITIPNSVTSIGNSAFSGCSSLTSITIPNSVTSIGKYAFSYCSSLTSVTIGDSVTSIESSAFKDCSSLTSVTIGNSVTSIGYEAFDGCSALREITLPASLKNIGSNAFAGTPRLYEVTCLTPEPPIAEESSFTNYDAYFHAYCDAQRYYSADPVWKRFHNVECIVNENTVTNNVTVTPSDYEVTVVWLSNDAAAAYSLVITKNGTTFCTLRFNKYGQLTNIAFAPSRMHNKQQAAEATSTGYSFTIIGLDAGTIYDYQFSVLNDSNESIDEYFGEFTTHSTTAVEQISSAEANCQKLLRDNQLLILRDGKTYNTMGAEIR